jgi:hypothetical protein
MEKEILAAMLANWEDSPVLPPESVRVDVLFSVPFDDWVEAREPESVPELTLELLLVVLLSRVRGMGQSE